MSKTKKHFEVNVQRGRRAKLQGLIGMKMAAYDDSAWNNIIPKKNRSKNRKNKFKDALEKEGECDE